jgi:hypothetical protein
VSTTDRFAFRVARGLVEATPGAAGFDFDGDGVIGSYDLQKFRARQGEVSP